MPLRAPRPFICALLLPIALALFTGCPKRVESPTGILDEAAAAAQSPGATPRQIALAGWHGLLVTGDADRARARFDEALAQDAGDPWALYGQLIFALRHAHPERGVDAALQLIERAPSHPLAAAAARFVLEMVGVSNALDTRILSGAERALTKSPGPDAAQLLRTAAATIHGHRLHREPQRAALTDMGTVTAWTLLGPFSAFNLLDFDAPLAPTQTGAVDGEMRGPFGKIAPRIIQFADGRVGLDGEPPDGDLYVLAADLEVTQPGRYIVRSVTWAPHRVLLDGTTLIERRTFERASSTVSAAGVVLEPGTHRLMVVFSRSDGDPSLSLSLLRADGAASQVASRAAEGAAAKWAGAETFDAALTYPGPAELASALEEEAGPLLAKFVAIRDGMERDPDGARRLMSDLAVGGKQVPALLALRADLWLADRTIPARVARGRATRDLERALELDKTDVSSLLLRAQLALDDGRQVQAAEWLKRAQAAHTPIGYAVPMLRARIDLSLGLDAQAGQNADVALQAQPGLCEALSLRYDLARRKDAVAEADALVTQLEGCPGSRTRLAEHARTRGRINDAIALYEGLVNADPTQVHALDALVGLYISARRYDDALALLGQARALWPRNANLWRRTAEVLDYAGRAKQALAAREQALARAGGDLALRRSVHRAKTGKELLAEHAIDGAEAIRRYEANPGTENADSVLVLDAAAVQAFEDGSTVDRIHVVQKALSQEGVSQIGEVVIPGGAEVLTLRTVKRDGTTLEPEHIAEKDSISMPAVQVGDYVEYEYLQANAPRGPAQPGFTAASFYFQLAGTPNYWSTYVVTAPRKLGMEVDAHNVKSPPPTVEGDQLVYRHDEKHVPPYIPEPQAPPNGSEYLPFVQLGAGAKGNDGLVRVYADAFIDRAQRTWEVETFARRAAEGKEGREAVRAVYERVMQMLPGRDDGLSSSASFSIAQERGSRLWALKSSLEALGIPTRVALIRTFFADPSPYLFPNESLLPYAALRAELPGGEHVWLDTAIRFAPFGELPEAARGRPAYLMPEPSRPLEQITTPSGAEPAGKTVTLKLALSEDGTLSGEGEERYTGFDAAQLREYLDQLAPDQRKQALQSALARYFGGAEMQKLDLELEQRVGADLVVRYVFRAPGFARPDGRALLLGPITFPVQLGRRFVQLGSRTTPLFVESSERTTTRVSLQLPKGFALAGPIGEVTLKDTFGRFVRREHQKGSVVTIEEDYALDAMRLPPTRYDAFAHFAGQVDLLQTRDLLVEKK